MARKQSSSKKIKKKKWFPVMAPKIFGNKILGELLLTDSILMKGRHMTLNLSNVLGDPRKNNTNIQFLIRDVKDGQGITEVTKYQLISSFTKRLVRRGRSKVEYSFITKTGDGKRTRVKILVTTNSYAHKSTETRLRLEIKKLLKERISKNTFERTVEELLKGFIQKEARKKVSKIAPLRNFEIRVFKIEEKRRAEEKEEIKPEITEKESKDVNKEEIKEEVKEKVKEETKEEKKEETKPTKASKEKTVDKKQAPKKVKEEKKEVKKEVKKKTKKETAKTTKKTPTKKK